MFLWHMNLSAAEGDNPPAPTRAAGIPPPPGLPIDSGISYLVMAGLLLGLVFIYRTRFLKK